MSWVKNRFHLMMSEIHAAWEGGDVAETCADLFRIAWTCVKGTWAVGVTLFLVFAVQDQIDTAEQFDTACLNENIVDEYAQRATAALRRGETLQGERPTCIPRPPLWERLRRLEETGAKAKEKAS
jgi:hypothetical protein